MKSISVLLALVIIMSVLYVSMFDMRFYAKQYTLNGVYDRFGREEVDAANLAMVSYLKGNSETINSEMFNEKEVLHLKDVKSLMSMFRFVYHIMLALLGFSLVWVYQHKKGKGIIDVFFYGSLIALSLLLLFLVMVLFNFSSMFTQFHLLLFDNDLWLLDPATDNLIVMFPTAFFITFCLKVVLWSGILSLILLGVSLYYRKRV